MFEFLGDAVLGSVVTKCPKMYLVFCSSSLWKLNPLPQLKSLVGPKTTRPCAFWPRPGDLTAPNK